MNNQQILEKAIQKAIDGGWNIDPEHIDKPTVKGVMYWFEVGSTSLNYDNYKLFIFNHDFAKALWGEDREFEYYDEESRHPWQYHLQQMVIAPDPIKYLEENLD